MGRSLDARMIQPGGRLLQRYLHGQGCVNLDGHHAITFAVALNGVTIAEKEMRAFPVDAQQHGIAGGDLLHVKIAAMGPLSTVRTAPCTGATPMTPIIGLIGSL